MEAPLVAHDTRRERVQAYVNAQARCFGITPGQITFKWEMIEDAGTPGSNRTDNKVRTLKVYLNKYWSTLVFTASEMKTLDEAAEQILVGHKAEILEAIRRLIGLVKPIPESECADRWLEDHDAFPGEPA